MIRILGIPKHVLENMETILNRRCYLDVVQGEHDLYDVTIDEIALIKFYGFDSSITIDIGSKKFILEKSEYVKVVLE